MFSTPSKSTTNVTVNGVKLGSATAEAPLMLAMAMSASLIDGQLADVCFDSDGSFFGLAEIGWKNLCVYTAEEDGVNIYPVTIGEKEYKALLKEIGDDLERDYADWVAALGKSFEDEIEAHDMLDECLEWIAEALETEDEDMTLS